MKYKLHSYDNDPCAYIVIDRGLMLYLMAAGCTMTRVYQGNEWSSQGGRWAAEIKFAQIEDADAFAASHLPYKAIEVEEVERTVERKKD